MANSRVDLNHPTITEQCNEAGERWGRKVNRRVVNAAKKKCPVDEGALRASIEGVYTGGNGEGHCVIGSPLDYAGFVHRGTGIYGPSGQPIRPVSARALKFQWEPKSSTPSGRQKRRKSKDQRGVFIRASVAGSPAQPFLADALTEVFGTLAVRFDNPT